MFSKNADVAADDGNKVIEYEGHEGKGRDVG